MKHHHNVTKFLVGVLSLLLVSFCWSSEEKSGVVELSATDKTEILSAYNKIKQTILSENTKSFLTQVSKQYGLTCTDSNYEYKEVSKFLNDKTSYLYISLFNSKQFIQQCGKAGYSPEYPPISEKEFLQTGQQTVTISSIGSGWVELTITSSVKTLYPRVWYLYKESGTWKISGSSFIVGDCTCG